MWGSGHQDWAMFALDSSSAILKNKVSSLTAVGSGVYIINYSLQTKLIASSEAKIWNILNIFPKNQSYQNWYW